MNRRKFIKKNSVVMGSVLLAPTVAFGGDFLIQKKNKFVSQRPPKYKRTFISQEVEKTIKQVKSKISDKELAWMFENCYPNTLDTTVDFEIIDGKPDTFIITGDIDAMWLRDSTAQVWPYMSLIAKDENLKQCVLGLIHRQIKCILKDPYANAFYKDLKKESHWKDDKPTPIAGVHERKWEIDSLCYVVRLSYHYYQLTGDTSVFDKDWDKAMRLVVKTFRTEQQKKGKSPYYFFRKTDRMLDAPFSGTGRPKKYTGLICSMFRPSDDATMYPYLIPSNIFASLSLLQLSDIYKKNLNDGIFAKECMSFANEIDKAIKKYAISYHLDFGEIYAYEVDGFGNRVFMDDANVPSLMSLAYLGAHKSNDPIYKRTRAFLLSESNPYYLKGAFAEGQASPHTGKEKIWHMGIILRAMTSQDKKEIIYCLKMLKRTHAGNWFYARSIS